MQEDHQMQDQLPSSSLESVLVDRAMKTGVPNTKTPHIPKPRISSRAPHIKLPEIFKHGPR